MGSKEVYSEDWWAEHDNENRCVAHRKNGEQCLKAAIRGGNVCRFHGAAAGHLRRKARERLELAADRMARELLGMATGAESEAVKLTAIRDALDRAGLGAKTEVSVEVKQWEQLMGDIAGVATISGDQHLAIGRTPVIDAELVEPPTEDGPETGPSSPVGGMRGPDPSDGAATEMPPGSGKLMTLEEAANANCAATGADRPDWHR